MNVAGGGGVPLPLFPPPHSIKARMGSVNRARGRVRKNMLLPRPRFQSILASRTGKYTLVCHVQELMSDKPAAFGSGTQSGHDRIEDAKSPSAHNAKTGSSLGDVGTGNEVRRLGKCWRILNAPQPDFYKLLIVKQIIWWRRRGSNPRPKMLLVKRLHA